MLLKSALPPLTIPLPVRAVAVVGDRCGEGIVWCPEEHAVYWSDISRFLVHRLTWPDCRLQTWEFPEPATALALSTEPGRLMLALASKLVWWWPAKDRREDQGFVLPNYPEVRLNDGRADPAGIFWVGSMYNNVTAEGAATDQHLSRDSGKLFRVTADGRFTEQVTGIGISNTLCWSPDRSHFYFADSMANEVRRYTYEQSNGAIALVGGHLCGYPMGVPDGSAIDAAGYLWNCRWGGGGIVRVAPDGSVYAFHPVPTMNLTTCAFGATDLKTLFVTSATNSTEPKDRLAGSLWAMDTDVPGLPANRVAVPTANAS